MGSIKSSSEKEVESHRMLAWSCLGYVEVITLRDMSGSRYEDENSGSETDPEDRSEGFMVYVAEYCHHHIREALLDNDKALVGRIKKLCDTNGPFYNIWKDTSHTEIGGHDVNALWVACLTGMTALVERLLEPKNIRDARNYESTLLVAASQGHDRVLDLLLRRKEIRKDLRDTSLRSVLQCAVTSGDPNCVRILPKEANVEVETWNKHGRTPFGCAIWNRNSEMIQAFLDSKHEKACNATNTSGQTPFIEFGERGGIETFERLIESGMCDIHFRDRLGRTFLHDSNFLGVHNL